MHVLLYCSITIMCMLSKQGMHYLDSMVYLCFQVQGSQLEPVMGTAPFALLLAELLAASQVLTVALAWLGAAAAPAFDAAYSRSCAVGFSGVLFGLKVVLNTHTPDTVRVAGYHLSAKVPSSSCMLVASQGRSHAMHNTLYYQAARTPHAQISLYRGVCTQYMHDL